MEGAYPFEDEWPMSCGFQCHKDRTPPSSAPGIDIAALLYTPVHAIAAGVAVGIRYRNAGGISGWVDHGNGWMSYYAHLFAVAMLNGMKIEQDQVIGYVGSTGHSTGPHLHLSVKRGSVWVDPELVLSREESA